MGRKRLPGLTRRDGYLRHPFDAEFGVETSGLVHGRHLATGHRHDKHNTAYYGIAPSVVEGLLAHWRATAPAAPLEDWSFIDLGAGMGRAVLVASRMPFREVAGVELHPELVAIAQKNVKLWERAGRARCPIRVVPGDVAEFDFPRNPCVAYMFNPFREPVVKALLRRMEASFASRPGQLDLIYANDECEAVLAANPRWTKLWRGLVPLSKEDEAADRRILDAQPDGEYAWSTEEPCSIYRFTGKAASFPAAPPL